MLKFYYNPLSPNARRVWLTLLEKEIPFEPIILKLDGDQLQPEFLEVNPFHHIPAIADDGFRIVESLAILDYLEAKYPTPSLMPSDARAIATVRMVQLLIANELFPQVITLIYESDESPRVTKAKQQANQVLKFLANLLGDRPFFGADHLTLADIVAGTALPMLPRLGVSLSPYPTLETWHERLMQRKAWQLTQISSEDFEAFKRRVRVLVKLKRRELTQSSQPQVLTQSAS